MIPVGRPEKLLYWVQQGGGNKKIPPDL